METGLPPSSQLFDFLQFSPDVNPAKYYTPLPARLQHTDPSASLTAQPKNPKTTTIIGFDLERGKRLKSLISPPPSQAAKLPTIIDSGPRQSGRLACRAANCVVRGCAHLEQLDWSNLSIAITHTLSHRTMSLPPRAHRPHRQISER